MYHIFFLASNAVFFIERRCYLPCNSLNYRIKREKKIGYINSDYDMFLSLKIENTIG